MKFGIVGLGRMGLSLGKLAVERGHEVVAWDPEDWARKQAEKAEMPPVANLEDLVGELSSPHVILMWAILSGFYPNERSDEHQHQHRPRPHGSTERLP